MQPSAVTDRLTVSLAEAKGYLRVEHDDEDTLIETLIQAAKASADAFLNNPFLTPDGTPKNIPDDVKLWVLKRVSFAYENRVENLLIDQVQGVGLSDYGGRLEGATVDMALIRPYRLNPGL